MNLEPSSIEINGRVPEAYERLRAERQRTLVAPEDDMWATFADIAEPHSLTCGGQLVGRFSVDEENQLHGFYIGDDLADSADELLARVVQELHISAAMASTVDPRFLSLSRAAGRTSEPVALMYDYIAKPSIDQLVDVRLATIRDHSAVVAFYQAATGAPESFLMPFLAERIDLKELYLVEANGTIHATGECRLDKRAAGNAHLGLVVGAERRGQGMGSRLMHTLTEISKGQDLRPLCSTEPTNIAAQRVIERAGFENHHQVLRIMMS